MSLNGKSAVEVKAKKKFDRELGSYLKDKRVDARLSQMEIAEQANLQSSQFISNIERGLCAVPNYILIVMIEMYILNPSEFTEFISKLTMDYYKEIFASARPKAKNKRKPRS